jgi:4-hydroxybenzoate polyprenyltransferase
VLVSLLKSARPQQWIKNLAVLAPAFFAGQIFHSLTWNKLAWAFILLSLASSGSYLINDLLDKNKDKLHPLKAHRPIASGKLPEWLVVAVAVGLLTFSLLASLQFRNYFTLVLASFIGLQLAYSLFLKRVILVDVMSIAATFSLRVFAGAFILPVPISAWLIITTVTLALLLAIGKRRAEVTLLSHRLAARHREVTGHYPNILLDGLTFMMATATIITYALFTFNLPEIATRRRIIDLLPQTLANPRWLMITVPFVIYGVFRYLYVIYEKKEGSSPERVLIYDLPLLLSVAGWALAAYFALYVVVR